VNRTKEIYNELFIDGIDLVSYLNNLPVKDQAWVNMYMAENILSKLYHKNIYANMSIPILLQTLAHHEFTDYLEQIVKANQFLLENIILSVKLTSVDNEEQLIKNILTLSHMGVKISLILDDINQNVYNAVQKY